MIVFQKPYNLNNSLEGIQQVIDSNHLQGDGVYTQLCQKWLKEVFLVENSFMMTSCTHALECALKVMNLQQGDEVIVPSFTYPSTANAVVLAGGRVVFAEVEGQHLTLNPETLMGKITKRTKAIIVVHYGGVSCQMKEIMAIAKPRNILVVEDAAQSFLTPYEDAYTGTIGDFGCFSFHGTKDFVAGEGGALLVNNPSYVSAVEIYRQKGTNRTAFLNGKSAFYQWVTSGSSYSPGELSMAMLYGQLLQKDEILKRRRYIFNAYKEAISQLITDYHLSDVLIASSKSIEQVNGHLFFLVFKEASRAEHFSLYLYNQGIETRTHFVSLHESEMGKSFINQGDIFSIETGLGKRLIRLPIYPDLKDSEVKYIISSISDYLQINFSQ